MQTSGAEDRAKSSTFAYLAQGLAASGIAFRFHAKGRSMVPLIQDGDVLQVEPIGSYELKIADIVLFRKDGEFKAHRILRKKGGVFTTRGDAGMQTDGVVTREQVLGRVVSKLCPTTGRQISLSGAAPRTRFFLTEMRRRIAIPLLFILSIWFLLSTTAAAQIVVSGSPSSANAQVTGSGAGVTFLTISNYVVPAGSNRLMIVGISINTTANSPTSVTSVTYGLQSLTKIAGASTELNSMRVEMWQLIGPAVGTANITVTGTKSGGNGNKLGVVAGVITFTGVNQTSPIRSSGVATGSSGTASTPALSSSGADLVLDTLAVGGGITVTTPDGILSLARVGRMHAALVHREPAPRRAW